MVRSLQRVLLAVLLVSVSAMVLTASPVFAARPGDLDASFGTRGVTTSGIASAAAAVVPVGDRILTVGGGGLARFSAGGALDVAFGRGGVVRDPTRSVAVTPDGSLITAVAYYDGPSSYGFGLSRYTADGVLDASFGQGGRIRVPVPPDISSFGSAEDPRVAVQPDGRILLAGTLESYKPSLAGMYLGRLEPDGTPDPTFGDNGQARGARGRVSAVLVQRDGDIVLAGQGFGYGEYGFVLARYQPDGQLDPGFGDQGVSFSRVGTGRVQAVVEQPDGSLVAAGWGYGADVVMRRVTATGAVDPSFGDHGTTVTNFPRSTPRRPPGDPSGSFRGAFGLAREPDGDLVTVGAVILRFGNDAMPALALARYTSDGRLDPRFGSCGGAVSYVGSAMARGLALAALPGARLLVGGSTGSRLLLARYVAGDGPIRTCRDPFTPSTALPETNLSLTTPTPKRRVARDGSASLKFTIHNAGPAPAIGVRLLGAILPAAKATRLEGFPSGSYRCARRAVCLPRMRPRASVRVVVRSRLRSTFPHATTTRRVRVVGLNAGSPEPDRSVVVQLKPRSHISRRPD